MERLPFFFYILPSAVNDGKADMGFWRFMGSDAVMPENIQKWIVMMVQVTNTTLTIALSIWFFTWMGQKLDQKLNLPVLGGSLFTILGFIIGVLGAGASLRRFFIFLGERDAQNKKNPGHSMDQKNHKKRNGPENQKISGQRRDAMDAGKPSGFDDTKVDSAEGLGSASTNSKNQQIPKSDKK